MNLERLVELVARRHHDEDVHVAVNMGLAVGVGSEQDDRVRPEAFRHLAREATDHRHGDVRPAIVADGFARLGEMTLVRHRIYSLRGFSVEPHH